MRVTGLSMTTAQASSVEPRLQKSVAVKCTNVVKSYRNVWLYYFTVWCLFMMFSQDTWYYCCMPSSPVMLHVYRLCSPCFTDFWHFHPTIFNILMKYFLHFKIMYMYISLTFRASAPLGAPFNRENSPCSLYNPRPVCVCSQ